MSKAIRFLFLFVIIFLWKEGVSQKLGLLPSKIRWYQIRHDSLRVIYPQGLEKSAERVASTMLKLARYDPIDPQSRYTPISVILQPQTNISNGYVGLAPYVSEFYLQSSENPFALGSLPWEDLLAIHEYRHVQQVNAANTSLSHLVKFVLGELAFSGMYSLSVSNWLREGDAVYSETQWTPQGRGRLNNFNLPFREKLRDGEPWNYYHVRNGSYRTVLPDHYQLGYLMVAYGALTFGEATWDTIFREAPRFRQPFEPLSGVVKKYYGGRNKHLYKDAMERLSIKWKAEEVPDIHYALIPIRERDILNSFFDMTYPSVGVEGDIYTVISTFDSIPSIYRILPDGDRELVVSLGLQQDTYFDLGGSRMVWTELRFDPRWVRKDKNVIVVYDLKKKNKFSIEPAKGFYTPSLDQYGNRIVALHVDLEGHYTLQVLNAINGQIECTLPNPENLYLGYPIFSEDGQSIIATARNREGKMCLVEQSIPSGVFTPITPYSYSVLGRPVVHGHWIFITGGLEDKDHVYAVDKNTGAFYKVSGGNRAYYDPEWDPVQESIICSEYRLNGKKLVRLPADENQWQLTILDQGIKQVAGMQGTNLLAESPEKGPFENKKYSPWSNVVNLHSWLVTADDPVWGIELRSDNIMNNMSIATGYQYNRNNQAGGPYFDVSMGMWFPVVSFGFSNTGREDFSSDGKEVKVSYDEIYSGLTLPFTFTPGVYSQVLQLSSFYNAGINKVRPLPEGISDFKFNYASQRLVLINSRIRAHRQPVPSFAQRLELNYAREVTGTNISQWYLASDLAFPSFKPSNYCIVTGEYLQQDVDEESVQLNSNYAGARGFDVPDGETNYRLGITYGFPFWYPEFGFGSVLYVSRIRFQPFFDMAYTNSAFAPSSRMSSAGTEIIIDFDVNKISIGFRYARLLSGYEGSPDQFEFFIPSQRF